VAQLVTLVAAVDVHLALAGIVAHAVALEAFFYTTRTNKQQHENGRKQQRSWSTAAVY
jgi:hypothetical protein